jgi:hypothetical protein
VTSEEEKNVVLSSLKTVPYGTKQEKINVLSGITLKLKIFPCLPVDDSSVFHREIIGVILDILEGVAGGLFNAGTTEEEDVHPRSQFSTADGYNTCLHLLNLYKDKKYRERIAIILGTFYCGVEIPKEGVIIIDILTNSLKDYIAEKQSKSEEEHVCNLLGAMTNSSVNERNKQIFFDKGIV